jgi:hypothetical protein
MSDWFADFLQMHHNASPEDFEPTETPGYWRRKKPCDSSCREPIHGYLFNEGGIRHTVYKESLHQRKNVSSLGFRLVRKRKVNDGIPKIKNGS